MKKTLVAILVLSFSAAAIFYSCKKKDYKKLDCSSEPSSYSANIKPIISSSCMGTSCHGGGSHNGDFSTYPGLKSAADAGKLDQAVLYKQNMPPDGPLSKDDRQKIYCWIQNGALNN